MIYMLFTYKITWTSKAKNKLQADFSHKCSKNDFFFKLSDYPIMSIFIVYYKINLPKLICIDREMIEELGAIFSIFFGNVVSP